MLLVALFVIPLVFFLLFRRKRSPPVVPTDERWTTTRSTLNDASIRPFTISIKEDDLEDLRARLRNARLPSRPFKESADAAWAYGADADFVKRLQTHWIEKFDWRQQEVTLNRYNHYLTTIEGIDVHFMRARPEGGKGAKPLLLLHGWPGSFYEFHKVVPKLIDSSCGGAVFDVVCPSMPGYGFSEAAEKPGMSIVVVARIFSKLMERLGFESYVVQGGDWGSMVASALGYVDSRHCKGIHLNSFTPIPTLPNILRIVLYNVFPQLLSPHERQMLKSPIINLKALAREGGYYLLQSSKPHSIGYALNDSPLGLACYIIEKFAAWSDGEGVESQFTLDEMLTNVCIYWFTQTATSSIRLYKETAKSKLDGKVLRCPIDVPVALCDFPAEPLRVPKTLISNRYRNVVQCSKMSKGGHFAALEEPELLVEDVRKFCTLIGYS